MESSRFPLVSSTFALIAFVAGQVRESGGLERGPEFLAPLENITAAQGRDVHFTCVVNHLGDYRVAWIKSDSKAILAIHTTMITLNPRLSVTHNGHNTWKLYIHNVQAKDSGTYMCQVNTNPMESQMGRLIVVVPPDILDESDGGAAREGGAVELQCRATGQPPPSVAWRRDAGRSIILRDEKGTELKVVSSFHGPTLRLAGVQRVDMGAYLCIASNGVPPTVSKMYDVKVLFHPVIRVSSQLVAAPLEADVSLQCYAEASPKSLTTWYRLSGTKLISGSKYIISDTPLNEYALFMNLTIKNLRSTDFGDYICSSSNAFGKAEGTIRLQEIYLPPKTTTTTTQSTTTMSTTPSTTTRQMVVIKPKYKNTKNDDKSRQYGNVILPQETAFSTKNNSSMHIHDYSYKGDKLKTKPSGPPHMVYSRSSILRSVLQQCMSTYIIQILLLTMF